MFKTLSKILFLTIVISLVSYASADTKVENSYIYLFHLYYDNGQLFADRDVKFKYDVISEEFVPEILNTQFPYKGEVINLKGEVAKTFQFDPKQGNPNFLKGKISVKAPYIPDGQKVNFYDGQGSQILSIFVSESSFCNDDGVCNPNVGEDTKTCPSDCKTVTPVQTLIGPATGSGQSGMPMTIIYVLVIVGAGLGGWLNWKWWQKRRQQALLPIIKEKL